MPRVPVRVLRRWRVCVNAEPEDIARVHQELQTRNRQEFHVRFCVWQLERAPTTDRLHLQAYVEFCKGVKQTHVFRFFGRHVDARSCDAGTQENIDYVTKEDTREEGPFWLGEQPIQGQGARNDLSPLRQLVDEGAPELELWNASFETMVKHHQAFRQYRLIRGGERTEYRPIDVRVFWGDTGTGKTRRALWEAEQLGEHPPYFADAPDRVGGPKWFDGYDGARDIIVDDYCGEYGHNWFKRFLDGYAMNLPVKGGYVPRNCQRIWITSNRHPDEWYPELPRADAQALRRRYTTVIHFQDSWTPPETSYALEDMPSPDLIPERGTPQF